MKKLMIAVVLIFPFSSPSYAKEKSKIALKLELSAAVQTELSEQMKGLQEITQNTVEMISKGQWAKLKDQGNYLSKLVLSPIKNTSKLPAGFKKYANELQNAGLEMAMAASKANGGPILANYYRVLSTCMKCHADYAPNYFDQNKSYIPPEEFPKKFWKSPYLWH